MASQVVVLRTHEVKTVGRSWRVIHKPTLARGQSLDEATCARFSRYDDALAVAMNLEIEARGAAAFETI